LVPWNAPGDAGAIGKIVLKVIEKLRNHPGLFGRMARGGAWLGLGSAGENALRFVRNMVLARLLAPEAFGVMAIVLSICSLFQVLTGLGIKESIVQNPRGAERSFLNGAWWISVVRGLLLYAVAFVASPWIMRRSWSGCCEWHF
jgi:O-antigen/teichoic acid export membrane protein